MSKKKKTDAPQDTAKSDNVAGKKKWIIRAMICCSVLILSIGILFANRPAGQNYKEVVLEEDTEHIIETSTEEDYSAYSETIDTEDEAPDTGAVVGYAYYPPEQNFVAEPELPLLVSVINPMTGDTIMNQAPPLPEIPASPPPCLLPDFAPVSPPVELFPDGTGSVSNPTEGVFDIEV
jgi:hypothetical protein